MTKSEIDHFLSYAMKVKTDKVISLKQEAKNYKFLFILAQIMLYLLAGIMLINFNSYLTAFTAMFINKNSNHIYSQTLLLQKFVILVFFIICGVVIYLNKHYKKSDDKYKTLRINITEIIQNESHPDFCIHEECCDCREEYIKYMKKEHDIDVVIK